jgi:hypothetical protein
VPTPFRVLLTKQTDGSEEVCSGEIADEDWSLFATFRDYARDLESAEWVRAGLNAGYKLTFDATGQKAVEAHDRPSDGAVRELLHLLRPFVLQNEPTWYPTVNSRLRRYLSHPYLLDWLATGRRIFDNGHFHLYGQISINNLPLHDERTFALWLNAFEYHRDAGKRAQLTEAMNGELDELALAAFRSIVADRTTEVLRLALFITNLEQAPSNTPLGSTSLNKVT